MTNTTINKIILSATTAMFLTACGSSDTPAPKPAETALIKIKDYATSNTNPVPTVADYTAAGVTGVTEANLDAYNVLVDAKTGTEVDTVTELDALVANIPAPVVANTAPTADAGADASVTVNTPITVTGTGTDTDGTIASYSWTNAGTEVATTAAYTFSPSADTTLTLTVTDDDGATATDTVNITVTAVGNTAPTANAGEDASVTVNTPITVTGTGTDTDGTIASYSWTNAGTEVATTAAYTFSPSADTTLTLTVTDDDGATATDTVDITVTATAAVIKVSPLKTGQTTEVVSLDDGALKRGVEASFTRNDTDNTVKDNLTGLVWDDNVENNNSITYAASETLCATPKRLPTISELLTLVDYSKDGPSIDDAFDYKASTGYWSSESNTIVVDITYGGWVHVLSTSNMARCVDDSQVTNPIKHTFTKDGDIVTDSNSSLVWSQPSAKVKVWEGALDYCNGLGTSGEWYLPNINELNTLVGIDETKIPHAEYWSSTIAKHDNDQAWNTNIETQESGTLTRNTGLNVICVKDAE